MSEWLYLAVNVLIEPKNDKNSQKLDLKRIFQKTSYFAHCHTGAKLGALVDFPWHFGQGKTMLEEQHRLINYST